MAILLELSKTRKIRPAYTPGWFCYSIGCPLADQNRQFCPPGTSSVMRVVAANAPAGGTDRTQSGARTYSAAHSCYSGQIGYRSRDELAIYRRRPRIGIFTLHDAGGGSYSPRLNYNILSCKLMVVFANGGNAVRPVNWAGQCMWRQPEPRSI